MKEPLCILCEFMSKRKDINIDSSFPKTNYICTGHNEYSLVTGGKVEYDCETMRAMAHGGCGREGKFYKRKEIEGYKCKGEQ